MSAPARQCGQAMTETLLASLAIAAALLLPWLEGESPVALLLGALRGISVAFQTWLFLL